MTSVSTQNATIDYEVRGGGPSLVLINGLGFGRWGFFKQVPTLSRSFATITFDAREGRDPEGVVAGLASDAADLLAHLGVGRAHVLGTSLGGFVAQELALARPELVGWLVLVSTGHGGRGSKRMSPAAMGEMLGLGALSPKRAARLGRPRLLHTSGHFPGVRVKKRCRSGSSAGKTIPSPKEDPEEGGEPCSPTPSGSSTTPSPTPRTPSSPSRCRSS